ncbi:uncharacterized protein LOC113781069 [Coffea eugenioides]|uniref:uncharacterized protein LOC113781069 n=1 Tax=Coffea eugenioides TaxID=49369 RepID=UPI000F60640D|nr:uncharacterized protein LOC113781069 [Coffea eugenioides]
MEEKQLEHFSHEEHPLILCELPKENDGGSIDQKSAVCYGCQQQILDPAAYCCFPCDFFLHKRCAELPRQITHPMHSQHPLVLLRNPTYFSGACICSACGQGPWKFFTYHCSSCEFDLDVSCAILDQQEIKLDCHDHPLREQRPGAFYCNACREDVKDSSYLCTVCPFWIHKKCALLSSIVKHKDHDHSLHLAYSLPSDYRSFPQQCFVCWKKVHPSRWVYYCGPCRYFVHITCVVISQEDEGQLSEDIEYPISGERDQNVVKLPSSNAAQELIARFLLKDDEISSNNDPGKSNIPEEIFTNSHGKHPLVLSEKVQNLHDEIKGTTSDDDQEAAKAVLVCDWCIEPICSSDDLRYHACVECGYFVHLTCSNLPPELHIPKHPQHPFYLMYNPREVGLFNCKACRLWTNATYYKCEPCGLSVCIKCASASMITSSVKHDGHKKHLLIQLQSSDLINCTACGYIYRGGFGFACEDCHFYVCFNCALLPPATTQRWDKHPLLLIYPPYFEHPEEFYCVLCETEINPNCWMYHCRECDYSLHPVCVPQVNLFRRVKFGRSLNVNNHSHPLTHVPEAKYKSFCGSCSDRRLDWKPAFECESCRFYLCPDCAFEKELTDDEE